MNVNNIPKCKWMVNRFIHKNTGTWKVSPDDKCLVSRDKPENKTTLKQKSFVVFVGSFREREVTYERYFEIWNGI